MVHPSHDAAAGPQLDGYIPLGPPSDVITLYEGPLQLRVGDDLARQRPGEITLVLRSGSHLVWGVDLDGASYEERLQWQFREGSGVPMLRFAFHGTPLELETYLTGDGYGFFGHRTSNADDKTELASVVSHWVNLPHLPHGSRLCHEHDDGSWVEWAAAGCSRSATGMSRSTSAATSERPFVLRRGSVCTPSVTSGLSI